MSDEQPNLPGRGETRRIFIKQAAAVATVAAAGDVLSVSAATRAQGVAIVLDPSDGRLNDRPVQWATGQLRDVLKNRGVTASLHQRLADVPQANVCVIVTAGSSELSRQSVAPADLSMLNAAEATALMPGRSNGREVVLAAGADARGIVYSLLELADRVNCSDEPVAALRAVGKTVEQPANAIRSIARCFVSDVEDKAWFNDREFWQRYLTELAMQRFNRFSLTLGIGYDFTTNIRDCYFHFAYPFLVSVPGYDVRAIPLPDVERDRNLEMLRFISEETARRGLHFQLGLWTHAYKWTNSPNANYTIEGLTPDAHANYCRDALRTVLLACPAISGITFRIHGESGVPEASYDFWRTVFDGIVKCGRRVEIDMHAKGIDQQMIDVAVATGMTVNVSPKYWAEHMGLGYMQGAIRPLEMPPRETKDAGFFAKSSGSRRFLRYGYGDLLREDRKHGVLHRLWPGTQRLLLWGDPHLAADYGRASSFCGSAGVELCEPLSFKGRKGSGLAGGRDAYADASLRPAHDNEKYLCTYRAWGRYIYNPSCGLEVWRRWMQKLFGAAAEKIELSLSNANFILPLITTAHCPSAANNNYWPEIYTNMSIIDANKPHPYGDTLTPKRFGTVSSLDPEFFSRTDDFAEELLKGEPSAKHSPAAVARWLDDATTKAEVFLGEAKAIVPDANSAEFRRLAADVEIQSGLGRFFAAKFRAAVLYAIYERAGHRPALEKALEEYRNARNAWAKFSERAKDIYRNDITFGYEKQLRGHWLDRLPAIDDDLAAMEKLLTAPSRTLPEKFDEKAIERAISAVFNEAPLRSQVALMRFHLPPRTFKRGQAFVVEASLTEAKQLPKLSSMRLRYRHVNQAETWQVAEMELSDEKYRATIPADYTDSPFPLQYHFELRAESAKPWLYPGVRNGWLDQPYFIARQA